MIRTARSFDLEVGAVSIHLGRISGVDKNDLIARPDDKRHIRHSERLQSHIRSLNV